MSTIEYVQATQFLSNWVQNIANNKWEWSGSRVCEAALAEPPGNISKMCL